MQTAQIANNGNGSDENGTLPDLTNKELLEILLEEIARVREELKGDIFALEKGLSERMGRLEGEMEGLKKEMGGLRIEVHQNQTMFIRNHEELERRVGVLEGEGG